MKQFVYAALLTLSLSIAANAAAKAKPVAAAASASALAPGVYDIDPMHSSINFEIPHLVISSVEGKFKTFSGRI